jgi:hypothetical protein
LWRKGVYEDATIKASLISSASTPRLYGPRRVISDLRFGDTARFPLDSINSGKPPVYVRS